MNAAIESTAAQEIDPWSAAAEALAHPDPDGPTVRIRAAFRDLTCKESGPETYRRVRYPGQASEEWPDSGRLPRCDGRAATRRAVEYAEVPIGTLIVDYSREVYRGRRGRCSVRFGVAVRRSPDSNVGAIVWCEHRTLRSRPVWEVSLPGGSKTDVDRRR